MKKYLVKCSALILAIVFPFAIWIGYLMSLPDDLVGSIAGTIRYKADLLQEVPGPRVIFAGGSSSPYGTNCRMVEDQLGINAFTIGATAYLGLDLYLNLLDEYAKEGDLIVLALETSMMQIDSADYSLVWMGAGSDPDIWRCIPLSYLPGLFTSSYRYYEYKTQPGTDVSFNEKFGPLGDVIVERGNELEIGYNDDDPFDLSPGNICSSNLWKINAFAKKMEKRGITVVYAFAPFAEKAIVSTPEQTAAYEQEIIRRLNIPVIVTLEQAEFGPEYIHDSNNHLTSEGAVINTQNLIDGLRPYVAAAAG